MGEGALHEVMGGLGEVRRRGHLRERGRKGLKREGGEREARAICMRDDE